MPPHSDPNRRGLEGGPLSAIAGSRGVGQPAPQNTLAIAGLGAIGGAVARAALDGQIPGLTLTAAAARNQTRARELLGDRPILTTPGALPAQATTLLEALPAAAFDSVARPAVEAGRRLIILSSGQLLSRPDLIARAGETGAQIIVPSGAILGLDALRAAAEGSIASVTIRTRKPPASLKGAPILTGTNTDLDTLQDPLCLFEGPVSEAITHFPANVNVAATIALAGIGPDRTRIEVWADPALTRNTHELSVVSDICSFTARIEGKPSPDNPATGLTTVASTLACLRQPFAHLIIGT